MTVETRPGPSHEWSSPRPLAPRLDLAWHAASFRWGCRGLRTLQLALAILADYLGDDVRARSLYHRFAHETVECRLPLGSGFVLSGESIQRWMVGLNEAAPVCAPRERVESFDCPAAADLEGLC